MLTLITCNDHNIGAPGIYSGLFLGLARTGSRYHPPVNLSRPAGRPVLALVLVAVVAGCAAPAPDPVVAAPGSPVPSSSARTVDGRLPFDRYFAYDLAVDPRAQEQVDAQNSAIAACMAAEGFEWEPLVFPSPDDAVLASREFATEFGYGNWTVDVTGPPDPNEVRLMAMSREEREKYWTALDGPAIPIPEPEYNPDEPPVVAAEGEGEAFSSGMSPLDEERFARQRGAMLLGPEDEPVERSGCEAQAYAATEGESPTTAAEPQVDPHRYDDLRARAEAVFLAADRSPELAGPVAAWRSCMTEAGYPQFKWPTDPANSVFAQWLVAMGGEKPTEFPRLSSGFSLASDGSTIGSQQQQDAEIALAVTDFDCQVPYRGPAAEVLARMQQEFVDQNLAELEEYRTAMVGG